MHFFFHRLCSKAILRTLSVCLVASAVLVGSVQASDKQMNTLLKGGVVINDADSQARSKEQKGMAQVEAKILIPRPPEQVWSVVTNPQQLMREEKKVKKLRTVSKTGSSQLVEYTVLMNSLLPTFNYILKFEPNASANQVQFKRVSGSFKDFQGAWKLTPVENGNKTILTYSLAIDPGFFAPRFMVMQAIKSDLPSMMKNVKIAIDKSLGPKEPSN